MLNDTTCHIITQNSNTSLATRLFVNVTTILERARLACEHMQHIQVNVGARAEVFLDKAQ